jgi:hypothetical protein
MAGDGPLASAQDTSAGASADGLPRPEFLRRVQSLNEPEPRVPGRGATPDAAEFDPEHLQRMLSWAIEEGHLTGASAGDASAPAPHRTGDVEGPTTTFPAPSSRGPATSGTAPASQAAAQDQAGPPALASSCPDGFALDMATLGGEGSFVAERAERQDALSRALAADHGVSGAQLALAGFYIARLMPQEALGVLDGVEAKGATEAARAWLEAAALVLADRASELAAGALQDSSCQGADARLWRAVVIAAQGAPSEGILESDAIAPRLAGYPPELRIELGLRLAQAAVEAQTPEAVAQLLDLVEEAAPADEARARLLFLRGRLAASRGDFAGADASWREAAALPGEGGVRATLALAAAGLERGDLDEAAALAELERLAYDWRGHPLQLRIAGLSAALHERRGDLPEALGVLEGVALGEAGRPVGRAAAGLATDLMRRAYADASADVTLDQMTAFWRYEGFVPSGAEGAGVRLAFARALIAQGLPGPAIGLLEPLARDPAVALAGDAIDLLAEGYLRAKEPAQALDLLRAAAAQAPEPRPGRNRLAARALAALGRFAEAAGVLHGDAGEDTVELQADYLWKAGLWTEAAQAYRRLLPEEGEQHQEEAAQQAAIRLAIAAHMAKRPDLIQSASRAVAATGSEFAVSAFAPLPAPAQGRAEARRTAVELLERSRGLAELAERYGLGEREGE